MSKKLYSTEKWKRYLKARQDAEEDHTKRRSTRPRFSGTARQKAVNVSKRRFETVVAPAVFSIVNDPRAAMRFFFNLDFFASKYNLNLDLSSVERITTDAIGALLAILRRIDVPVRGNLPINADAQRVLLESGFFDHVSRAVNIPQVKRGSIKRQESKLVEPLFAKELVHFGTKSIYGASQRNTAAYSTLIECMANTRNHASGRGELKRPEKKRPPETWWATVYADTTRGKVCFTFVDTGVGIFRSVRMGLLRKFYQLFGTTDDTGILRDMLQGKVPSSTQFTYRGKGLPFINRLAQEKRISSLVIVANDVYANVSLDRFETLPTPFRGTLMYWEI